MVGEISPEQARARIRQLLTGNPTPNKDAIRQFFDTNRNQKLDTDEFSPYTSLFTLADLQDNERLVLNTLRETYVDDTALQDTPDYAMLAGDRLEGGADTARGIEQFWQRWRVQNAGNSFTFTGASSRQIADEAIRDVTPQDGDRRNQLRAKMRAMLSRFWNNDGPGIKFFSMQELEAVRQWGLANYGPTGQEQFQKDFNELFIKSIKEDTPFSVELITRQWAQLAGSSAFEGSGGRNFASFFDNFGTSLATELIGEKKRKGINLKPGDVLIRYNGRNEHRAFDNIIIDLLEENGQLKPRILRSPSSAENQGKIRYIFEGEGSGTTPTTSSTGLGQPSNIGASTTASFPPPAVQQVKKAKININPDKIEQELKNAFGDNYDNFVNYILAYFNNGVPPRNRTELLQALEKYIKAIAGKTGNLSTNPEVVRRDVTPQHPDAVSQGNEILSIHPEHLGDVIEQLRNSQFPVSLLGRNEGAGQPPGAGLDKPEYAYTFLTRILSNPDLVRITTE